MMAPEGFTTFFWMMSKLTNFALLLLAVSPAGAAWPLVSDANSWTGAVFMDIIGDSIPGGGGGAGVGSLYFPSSISNAIFAASGQGGSKFRIINHSIGGSQWTNMPAQMLSAATNNPRWLYVHCGINNVNEYCCGGEQVYPRFWPTNAAILDLLASNCAVRNGKLLVGEILPCYTNFQAYGYPGIYLLNAAYEEWCATNQYHSRTKFLRQHEVFGILNPTTGRKDWLYQPYQQSESDGLHLSQAAYDFWGPYLVSFMGEHYSGLPYMTGGQPITRFVP